MIVAWCTAALAADPLLDGLPGADGVVVTRGAAHWTVEVRGRSVVVDPVRDDADRAALRALVRALLAEVEVPAVPSSALASRAMAALGPPPAPRALPAVVPPAPVSPPTPETPPRPVVEPVASAAVPVAVPAVSAVPAVPAVPPVIRTPAVVPPPEVRRGAAPVVVSVGPELVVREGLGVGPGAAVFVGVRDGIGVRASLRPTRPVDVAVGAGVGELALDLTAWTRSDPVSVGIGVGAVGRRYVTDGLVVAAHVVPRVDLGAGAALPVGQWRIEPAVAVEVDLLRTRMGWDVATQTLSPMGFRTEVRFGRPAKKIEPEPHPTTPEGEPEPRGVR